MALQQTHVVFLKEVIENYPLLEKYNNKDLYYGSVYPDIFYVSLFPSKFKFSDFLHNQKNILEVGRYMLSISKTIREKSFSLGFISHFYLDSRIHGYLENIGYINGSKHLSLEFYLHLLLKKDSKVVVSKTPKNILIKSFKKKIKNFKVNKNRYLPNFIIKKLFLFVCNYILKETINVKYSKKNKNNFFKDLFFKLSFYLAFRHYGYSVYDILNPDYDSLKKHLPYLLKEYSLSKKDFVDFLNKNSDFL